MKLNTIYLDMDGVLCDFVTPAMTVHGRPELLQPGAWPKGVYTLEEVLGVTKSQFWEPIDNLDYPFWSMLPAYPWWQTLLHVSMARAYQVVILSKPHGPQSTAGKHYWLTHHFGHDFDRYAFTPHKHLLAGRGKVLIDDCEANIREWRNAGGIGLLFPQPWNNGEGDIETVLEELARIAS